MEDKQWQSMNKQERLSVIGDLIAETVNMFDGPDYYGNYTFRIKDGQFFGLVEERQTYMVKGDK